MKKFLNSKGIAFDLDYTLYDEGDYFGAVIDAFCDAMGANERALRMKEAFPLLRRAGGDIIDGLLAAGKFPADDIELKDQFFGIYISIDARVPAYPGVSAVLSRLRQSGLKLGLLTNGVVKAQQNKLRCLSIEENLFNAVVFARSRGREHEKPDIWPFMELSNELELSGGDLVFVGDNPRIDFAGAKAIGSSTVRILHGIFSDLPGDGDIDVEIGDMKELEGLLR